MKDFFRTLRGDRIVQGAIALIATSVTGVMWALQVPVEDAQLVIVTSIVTFYFKDTRRDGGPEDVLPEPYAG